MLDLKTLFLSPRGRIGRQTFILAAIALVIVNVIVGLIPLLGPLVALPLLWPLTCVTAKRLHDAGRSGMTAYMVGTLSFAVSAGAAAIGIMATDMSWAASAFGLAGIMLLLGSVTGLMGLAMLAYAATKRGDHTQNRFGTPEAMPLTIHSLLSGGL